MKIDPKARWFCTSGQDMEALRRPPDQRRHWPVPLEPARRLPPWMTFLAFGGALLALILMLAQLLMAGGCTGTGSPCWDADGCPAGWACVERKCEAPPVPVPGPGGPL